MPDTKPTPPPGYQLDTSPTAAESAANNRSKTNDQWLQDVPAFEREAIPMKNVRVSVKQPLATEKGAIANVYPDRPTRINVLDPAQVDKGTIAHELLHVDQFSRNPAIKQFLKYPEKKIGEAQQVPSAGDYDYGGAEGLLKLQRSGKGVAALNIEQMGKLIDDYTWQDGYLMGLAKKGTITPSQMHDLYKLREAYHPALQQIASMPGVKEKLDPNRMALLLGVVKPPSMSGSPAAPGLPDYSVAGLGVVPQDPLMGGGSAYTAPPSADSTRKVGQEKRFSNGKIGVWDGHGWVAK